MVTAILDLRDEQVRIVADVLAGMTGPQQQEIIRQHTAPVFSQFEWAGGSCDKAGPEAGPSGEAGHG